MRRAIACAGFWHARSWRATWGCMHSSSRTSVRVLRNGCCSIAGTTEQELKPAAAIREGIAFVLEVPTVGEAALEVISPDNSRHRVRVTETPFLIGRGQAGNHLSLLDRRISRQCAAIVSEGGRHYVDDRGHRL